MQKKKKKKKNEGPLQFELWYGDFKYWQMALSYYFSYFLIFLVSIKMRTISNLQVGKKRSELLWFGSDIHLPGAVLY